MLMIELPRCLEGIVLTRVDEQQAPQSAEWTMHDDANILCCTTAY